MIAIQNLVDTIASRLDANVPVDPLGSDYYSYNLDFVPAIDFATFHLTGLIRSLLGSNKFSEEALRELTSIQIFQTTKYSRVNVPDSVYSVVTVYGGPIMEPTSPTITLVDDKTSLPRPDIYYVGATDSAKHYSSEQYADNRQNPFSPVYSGEVRKLGQFGWREMVNYGSNVFMPLSSVTGTFTPGGTVTDTETNATAKFVSTTAGGIIVNTINGQFFGLNHITATGGAAGIVNQPISQPITSSKEIEVAPYVSKGFVGLETIRYPTKVTVITGFVEFPETVKFLLVELVLLAISYKQGDGTNIATLSMEQIKQQILQYK